MKESEKEQGEKIPPQCGSFCPSKMVDEVVLWPLCGPTHVIKAYNNQLIYYATGISC